MGIEWSPRKRNKVKKDDTVFSVAEQQLGNADLVRELLLANPDVAKFVPGQYVYLPNEEDLQPFQALSEAEGRAAAATGGTDLNLLFPEAPPPAEEEPSEPPAPEEAAAAAAPTISIG